MSYKLWENIFLGDIVHNSLISFFRGNCILWEMVLGEVVYFRPERVVLFRSDLNDYHFFRHYVGRNQLGLSMDIAVQSE